jgi:hypothetical protein
MQSYKTAKRATKTKNPISLIFYQKNKKDRIDRINMNLPAVSLVGVFRILPIILIPPIQHPSL